MTDLFPITPPPELWEQWYASADDASEDVIKAVATQAARWGADQELEACCGLLRLHGFDVVDDLRATRRPKPSLKEQALEILGYPKDFWSQEEVDTIRRALEQLDD